MASFLSGMVGDDGVAKVIGDKVGDVVEDTVKKVMGGGGGGEQKEEEKKEGGGGFGLGDALSLAGGKKEEGGGGLDVKNMVGGLFK